MAATFSIKYFHLEIQYAQTSIVYVKRLKKKNFEPTEHEPGKYF